MVNYIYIDMFQYPSLGQQQCSQTAWENPRSKDQDPPRHDQEGGCCDFKLLLV